MRPNNLMDLLRQHRVVVPPIQRDYAQGREDRSTTRVRERFLAALTEVLDGGYRGEPLNLDFIYGFVGTEKTNQGTEISVFKPLDGQQRLTTLFLLHWYAAVKEDGVDPVQKELLGRFSYATRTRSRQFCEQLVEFEPNPRAGSIREQIENQPWFFMSWFKDPTIASMLVVLDAIESICNARGLSDIWGKLAGSDPRIRFHLLEMTDIGLPDDLYIKMNSRGKELTDFEYFKSFFSRCLRGERRSEFIEKIDKGWSDLFWSIFKDQEEDDLARQVDAGFLRFFRYITDVLTAEKGLQISVQDEWEEIAQVYKDEDNVGFLFDCLDLFADQQKNDPDCFARLFYSADAHYQAGKVRLFFAKASEDLFRKCARAYDSAGRVNPFSLGEQLLLYAFIVHRSEETENFSVSVRLLRNLVASSEDRIRKEHLGSLCHDVECIVRGDPLSAESRFSKAQVEEESRKAQLLDEIPGIADTLFQLEDHNLLRGTISVFDINADIPPLAEKFHEVFGMEPDYFGIGRAMLAMGDYSQLYGGARRFGNHNWLTWRELFTPNEYREGFQRTREVLRQYLQRLISNSDTTNDDIVSAFDGTCLDWRYYYIHYNGFREWNGAGTDGFYYWKDFDNKPFECYMMYKRQFNGRHWVPYLLTLSELHDNCSIENYGSDLKYACGPALLFVSMQNDGFTFTVAEDDGESQEVLGRAQDAELLDGDGRFLIPMKSPGEDEADRIHALLEVLRKMQESATPQPVA